VAIGLSSGLIAGTLSPTSTGTYSVTVTVSDGSLTDGKTFTWTVNDVAGPPSLQQPADQISGRNAPCHCSSWGGTRRGRR
jgi:hypothetical protein